jgi:hypothetical protein
VASLLSALLPRRLQTQDEARAALIWVATVGENICAIAQGLAAAGQAAGPAPAPTPPPRHPPSVETMG